MSGLQAWTAASQVPPRTTYYELCARRLVITWPKPGQHLTATRLEDADTGEQLTCVTKVEIAADCSDDSLTATLTMICDLDGDYLRTGQPVRLSASGKIPTKIERWTVAEMRTS